MERDPFKEYLKESEPDKVSKGYAWSTAIGLQAVDGLKPSKYLIDTAIANIEGEITIKEAQKLVKYNDGMLKSRYEYMTNSDMRDCRTRHMMIDSSILGLEKTAKYIMQLIDLRFEN